MCVRVCVCVCVCVYVSCVCVVCVCACMCVIALAHVCAETFAQRFSVELARRPRETLGATQQPGTDASHARARSCASHTMMATRANFATAPLTPARDWDDTEAKPSAYAAEKLGIRQPSGARRRYGGEPARGGRACARSDSGASGQRALRRRANQSAEQR